MNTETVRSKIRKLLALANDEGAAANEAETAMRQAEKLMRKHGIDLAALAVSSGSKPIYKWAEEFVPSSYPKPVMQCPLWFQWIGIGIAHFTDTRVTIQTRRSEKTMGLFFQGDEVDVEYAVWLAERLREEIRTQAAMYNAPGDNSDQRWANREEFRHAMARRIKARLEALRAEREEVYRSTGTALVVVSDKIAQRDQRFGKMTVKPLKGKGYLRGEMEARAAGVIAGNNATIHRPVEEKS